MDASAQTHPVACASHVAFKAAAVAYYVLCGLLGMGFVINFVVCVILLSMDFWVVKNVTGRLLVGLRWWNEIKEDGTSEWQFESADMNERAIDKKESTWFWTWLFAAPAAWSFLAIVACVKFNFDYLLISIMAIMLGSANVMGYWKCSKDAKEKMSSMANDVMGSSVRAAVGRFFSRS
uniref:Golgi apparatus membrane protein TVP23 n=2 Tax=Picocystis salinarum TaxID=88271 RepID=A0A7S3U9S5_9CHLO